MHSQLHVLSENQLTQVSGGHSGLKLPLCIAIPLLVVELIHVREFYNYVADRAIDGCSNIEEGDHFTKLFCWK